MDGHRGRDGIGRHAHRFAAASVGCLTGVAAIGIWVHAVVPTADTWLHALVLRSRGPADLSLARTLTQAGSTRLVWPVIAVAAMAFPRSAGARRWVEAAAVVAGAGAAIGVRLAFSVLVHRGRPPQGDWTTYAGGFALPSGHTTAATVGVGLLAWAVTRHLSHRQARVAAWAAVVVCAGTVGWTRVWLGVHWPSDVAGGWLLGAGWQAGMAAVTCWLEASSRRPDHDQSTSDAAGTPAADRPGTELPHRIYLLRPATGLMVAARSIVPNRNEFKACHAARRCHEGDPGAEPPVAGL